ncbi:MAG: response regulator transcription factor [Chloroflexota bacterium]|nr:response regulator transcription factor [Chloroflexota bacterium]
MRILVVDDDRLLADLISFTLRREGWEVLLAHDGETALRRWREEMPDLLVLDVNLPDTDGFTLCRQIRSESDTPIILLTVRGDEDDIVHGLQIGADDYIPKPFSPRQLVARAEAVLRRAGRSGGAAIREVGDLQFDPSRRELQLPDGETILLSSLEKELLDYLIINAGHVLTYEAIIDQVWGPEGATRSMLRQLVYRLRNKIEANPSNPKYIRTVPGIGYELMSHPDP